MIRTTSRWTRALALTALALPLALGGGSAATADEHDYEPEPVSIRGVVVAEGSGGAPVEGVDVAVERLDSPGEWAGGGYTDRDGSYEVRGLAAGSYVLRFADYEDRIQPEWYRDAGERDAAEAVVVTDAQVTQVDGVVTMAINATGTLLAADTGQPVPRSYVTAEDAEGNVVSSGGAGLQGQFALDRLAPGTYTLRGHADRGSAYVDGPPQQVTVPDSGRVDGLDLRLRRGGAITGRVTDAAGQPLSGIKVGTGYWHNGYGDFTGDHEAVPTQTDADGRYSLQGLQGGTYRLQFVDPTGAHGWTFWRKASDRDGATGITLTLGQTVPGVSVALKPAASIAGRVVSAETGQPLEMVCFEAVDASAGHLLGTSGCSDADGRYTVRGLGADAYKLQVRDATDRFVGAGTVGPEAAATVLRTRAGKTTSAGQVTYVPPPPVEEPPFEEPPFEEPQP